MARVGISMEEDGAEVTVHASPQTLREIADVVEQRGRDTLFCALAVDVGERMTVIFTGEFKGE